MAFGFPAYARDERQYDLRPKLLKQAVAETLDDLRRTSYGNWSGRAFTANVRLSLWSWGENVTVKIDRDGFVWIESKCALPTQCFDWGKNQRNVNAFFKLLDEVVQEFETETDDDRSDE